MAKTIRSRIKEHLGDKVVSELLKVCNKVTIADNNAKAAKMLEVLNFYKIDYIELGPGTNRLAVLIDNYVFKIAMDKWGKLDNANEFTTSEELQPYVVKTYEVDTDSVISVCEYVTVISREEFIEKRPYIRSILADLAESYLVGDVGTIPKNFLNWGYRDDGQLVVLDFAYIYRVRGEDLLCSNDQEFLEYDDNFHNLICPYCGKKYTFMDIRRRISMEEEQHEHNLARELAYAVTEPINDVKPKQYESIESPEVFHQNHNQVSKEETDMSKDFYNNNEQERYEDPQEAYERELEKQLEKRKNNLKTGGVVKQNNQKHSHQPRSNQQIRNVERPLHISEPEIVVTNGGEVNVSISATESVNTESIHVDIDIKRSDVPWVDTLIPSAMSSASDEQPAEEPKREVAEEPANQLILSEFASRSDEPNTDDGSGTDGDSPDKPDVVEQETTTVTNNGDGSVTYEHSQESHHGDQHESHSETIIETENERLTETVHVEKTQDGEVSTTTEKIEHRDETAGINIGDSISAEEQEKLEKLRKELGDNL